LKETLILGAQGQDGSILESLLVENVMPVISVSNAGNPELQENSQEGVKRLSVDIRNTDRLLEIIKLYKPATIVNFASLSSVWKCEKNEALSREINQDAVLRLIDGIIKNSSPEVRSVQFIQASSSEMYSNGSGRLVDEETPLNPRTVYGKHKARVHSTLVNHHDSGLLNATSMILFNHESPLRPESFVSRKISRNIAKIIIGEIEKFELGDLQISRDWGYAPDYVQLIKSLIGTEANSAIVLASGKLTSLFEICEMILKHFALGTVQSRIISSNENIRAISSSGTLGNPTLAQEKYGLVPSKSTSDIFLEMIEYDLNNLRKGDCEQQAKEWLKLLTKRRRVES
jgi:GDPmannose 4,6-dehydratase